jgi:dihydroorotate dehydrogenase electron transfer subunit
MRQSTAVCNRLELIGTQVRIHFQTDLFPALGQFFLARLAPTFDPYLPYVFYPSSIDMDSGFTIELAATDSALRFIAPGQTIELWGPIGQSIPDLPARSRLLLVAESSPAVLLPFASQAIAREGTATLLLAKRYPLESLQPEIELRVGDLPALLTEFAPTADSVFIHTSPTLHPIFYQTLSQVRALVATDFARALITLPMPCGVGACQACYVKTRHGHKLSCLSGPFFSLAELNL